MVPANDIAGRSEEIRLLIAEDNVGQATKRVMDFVRDFSEDRESLNEVVVISNSFSRLERKDRQGLLDFDEADKQRRRLLFQILGLVDAVEQALALKVMAA
jgi:hypothetical protein